MAYNNKEIMAQEEESPIYDSKPEQMSIGRYLATRLPTLKPPMAKAPNPIRLLRLLNRQQWLFWLVGFCGWTWVSTPVKRNAVKIANHGPGRIRLFHRIIDRV